MPGEQDHVARLTRLEAEMGFFRTNFDEVKALLKQLAEDMHKLAISDAERRDDRKIIDRIGNRLDAKDAETVRLWGRIETIESSSADAENERLREELKRSNRWITEVGKILLILAASIVAAHFSVKFL